MLSLALVLTALLVGNSRAAVLLEENFDSGTANPANWDVYGLDKDAAYDTTAGSNSAPDSPVIGKKAEYVQVDGNGCIRLTDWWGTWDTAIISKNSFPRGNNLRVTWTCWHDGGGSTGKQPSTGFLGPWNYNPQPHIPAFIEAGFRDNYAFYHWSENHVYSGTSTVQPLGTQWWVSDSRAHAIKIRITLGDVTGALGQYSTDFGANWQTFTVLGVPLDTRGMPAGSNFAGTQVSSHTDNKIVLRPGDGLHWGKGTYMYVDDIIVENDVVLPVELSDFDAN